MSKVEKIKFITDGKWDWEHGLGHMTRVTNYIRVILTDLGVDEKTLELGLIAGLLHDIGLITGRKEDHARISATFTREYLKKYDIVPEEIDIIAQAIFDHSEANSIKSIVGAALALADKLDATKYRVINSSIQDEMNKEIAKIEDVNVKITDKEIIINYITNATFNPLMLRNWRKAITVPIKIAKHLNKSLVFMIDEDEYNFFKIIEE